MGPESAGAPVPARSWFQRVTTGGTVMPELDGVRWWAFLGVFWHHLVGYLGVHSPDAYTTPVGRMIRAGASAGSVAVPVFFVLSAYILGRPFARGVWAGGRVPALGDYLKRRAWRLWPPYLFNLLVLALILQVTHRAKTDNLPGALGLGTVYAHTLVTGKSNPINVVTWSLEVEVQFYLLLPLLAAVFRWPSTRARLGLWLGLGALLAVGELWYPIGRVSVFTQLEFFLAGLWLAEADCRGWLKRVLSPGGWDFVALIAWPLAMWGATPARESRGLSVLLALVILAGLAGVIAGRYIKEFLSWRPFVVGGVMCYTLYLWHYAVIAAVGPTFCRWTEGWSYPARVALAVPLIGAVVVAICTVLFLLIERPLMENKTRARPN